MTRIAGDDVKRDVGIHAGISFVQYQGIDAVNNSLLKMFRQTPAHAHYKMTHPEEDTESLRLGDAVHVAILEPARFEREYIKSPKFDKRSNAGKAAAAEWIEKHGDQAAILPDEWDWACAMRDSVWAHPLASELLKGAGQNEMTALWIDKETGLLCKARPDRFTNYRGWSVILDIKTTSDPATPEGFGRACAKYLYHWQAAFYLDGLNTLAAHKRRWIHLVVEKEPPYCIALMELDDSALEEGRQQYRRALALYAECMKKNEWLGYPVGVEGMDIPRWAYELTCPPK